MKKNLILIFWVTITFLLPFVSRAASLDSDTTLLKEQVKEAIEKRDTAALDQATHSFIAELNGKYSAQQLNFIKGSITSTKSEAFRFFFNNQKSAGQIIGKDATRSVIEFWVFNDYLKSSTQTNSPAPDWEMLAKRVKPFGAPGIYILNFMKWAYYFNKKDWIEFVPRFAEFTKRYPDRVNNWMINNYMWDIFENCGDKSALETAEQLQENVVNTEPKGASAAQYMDTYACILYRLGKQSDAILWEKKAIAEATADTSGDFEKNLRSMQNNERLWKAK